ncbi:MAG: M3 family metallopeptidase [Candidatus Gracilibacteria bacterium]
MKLKKQIIEELNRLEFPNLKFLFSEEVLDIAPEVLNNLLKTEKQKFNTLLLIETAELTFNSFEEESLLDYFWALLNHLDKVGSSDITREIINKFRPILYDFMHEVSYSKDYFEHLMYVNDNVDLDSDEKRIMYLRIKAFKDRGINLNEKDQEKLKKINKSISKINDDFSNNIIDDEKTFEYIINDFELIKDLPIEVLDITKAAYNKVYHFSDDQKDGYLFDSDPTSHSAIMKYCSSKKIRLDFETRGNSVSSKGKFDNRKNILKLLKLKQEKSDILGYKNYAELSLNNKMAESPKQVFELVEGVSMKAKQKADVELNILKEYYNLKKLETCDVAFYSRKYKEEKYNFDEKELKKYFEFENVITYLFKFVEKFYGVEIRPLKLESYNSDIKIYEIYRNKELISYYFLDPFYRESKASGAWANNLREKIFLPINKIPVVLNVCNFQKAESGKTTLYLRDVETIFHEFGHALHEILSESKHSELSGFGVEWDFVELPSQLLENWANQTDSLVKLSSHINTGKSLQKNMINKLEKLKTYMTGVFVARQNEFALLDMTLYSSAIPKNIKDLDKIVLEIVNKHSVFKRSDNYKMYCHFSHIFSGGYSAGYYSYLWAEIIEADIFSKMKDMGMFDPKTGKKFLETILGQGTRKKATELFFDFMGREVDNKAFMERYGL